MRSPSRYPLDIRLSHERISNGYLLGDRIHTSHLLPLSMPVIPGDIWVTMTLKTGEKSHGYHLVSISIPGSFKKATFWVFEGKWKVLVFTMSDLYRKTKKYENKMKCVQSRRSFHS